METIFEQMAEWQKQRLGKFTSSEIWKLMQKGRAKDSYFGETAQTYIKGRLAEILTQEPVNNLDGLASIEWGNSNEIDAVMDFEKRTGLTVEYYGKGNPQFFPFSEHPEYAGGSPDGFVGADGVIEVKCPYNSTHHITHMMIGSPYDLLKEKPDYYGQLQFNMLCAARTKGYFVSYDPRMLKYELRLHVIELPLNESYCEELIERLEEAIKLLKAYLGCIEPELITA